MFSVLFICWFVCFCHFVGYGWVFCLLVVLLVVLLFVLLLGVYLAWFVCCVFGCCLFGFSCGCTVCLVFCFICSGLLFYLVFCLRCSDCVIAVTLVIVVADWCGGSCLVIGFVYLLLFFGDLKLCLVGFLFCLVWVCLGWMINSVGGFVFFYDLYICLLGFACLCFCVWGLL